MPVFRPAHLLYEGGSEEINRYRGRKVRSIGKVALYLPPGRPEPGGSVVYLKSMYVEPAWTGFIGGWHAENGCIALAYPKAQPIGEVMTFEKLMSGRNLTECHIFNLVDMSTFRFHFEMEDTGRSKT